KFRWVKLALELKESCKLAGVPSWEKVVWTWVRTYALDAASSKFPILNNPVRIWRTLRRRNLSTTPIKSSSNLNPEFAQRIGLVELNQSQLKPPKTEKEDHYRRLSETLIPGVLEILDRTAGASSIEIRFPFWDKRLVEFCLSLPPEQKRHQGWTRLVMRRAMSGILPEEVQWRVSKSNLSPSFYHNLLAFEQERLEEIFLKNPEIIQEYVNITALREAYSRYVSGEATGEDEQVIWKSASLALWLQRTGLTASG
ncbi:MAG TPA: asparagine synthase-related protein, partial [Candidatus Obscuribacterales bacterium]